VRVNVDVQNVGRLEGKEIVQLYLTDVQASVPVAIRSLVGIASVDLKPGEKRNVPFKITPEQMSLITDEGKRVVEPGEFIVYAGGKQPGPASRPDNGVSGRFVLTGKPIVIP
jgi:beta-glucosidase